MSSALPNQRAALRQAIAERDGAKEAVRVANEAARRGKELLLTAQAHLAAFGDVDDAILKHRAASFKTAAQGGAEPTLTLPDDLLKRERGRDEAASAVAAAKAAHDSLAADAAQAESALRRAEREVSERAVEILMADAVTMGSSLIDAWNELWLSVDTLNALRGTFPIQLPRPIIQALQRLAGFDHRQFAGGRNVALAQAGERWRAWHTALCQDAEAEMPNEQIGEEAA